MILIQQVECHVQGLLADGLHSSTDSWNVVFGTPWAACCFIAPAAADVVVIGGPVAVVVWLKDLQTTQEGMIVQVAILHLLMVVGSVWLL